MALRNRITTEGDRPAELWSMRAAYTPVRMRQALGQNLRLLARRRLEVMSETIYNRGENPPGRFTGNLRRSERAYFVGARAVVANTATSKQGYAYAQRRHDMRGYSKRYRCRKESFWATKAVRDTAPERNRNVRAALRDINAKK